MARPKQNTTDTRCAQLSSRLDDYSALTRVSAATGKLNGRVGNWPVYAAAVGSALALASNASASLIHYCGPSDNYCEASSQHPTLTASAAGPIVHIPLLQTALHQVNIEVATGTAFGFSATANLLGANVKFFDATGVSSGLWAHKFNAGANIGASVAANLQAQGLIKGATQGGFTAGNFQSGVYGFAGLAISGLGSLHNQTDYGWIRLKFTESAGYPNTLTVKDWAVNLTSGESILAGQEPPPAPEPGTMGLALLASGAAGIVALRRRKASQSAAL